MNRLADWSQDKALARLLLRLSLGLNLTAHGLVRVPHLRQFAEGMTRDFAQTLLPSVVIMPYALVLPWVEALIGLLLILGLRQRAAIVAGMLVMMSLVFGTALLQRWDVLTQQMVYVVIYFLLLASREWDRWSLDARASS